MSFKEGRGTVTLEQGVMPDPARLREAIRGADFTPTWVRATIGGTVAEGNGRFEVTVPGKLIGPKAESREVETAPLELAIPALEQRLVLFETEAAAALEPGVAVELTGLLFTGAELEGTPENEKQTIFLLVEAAKPRDGP